ncbi:MULTISPECIES: F0F1 ATP synthase subunit epsilon [Alphaproteobacteria]|uniref:ATP synthase epsilon chain n=2 Tax=Alphaproteobacteria TaxID=28211 RepID=A0A512HKZ9_9HYPH|nr:MULTISPECIES: F0F1 ATP synthase subunit epsilon [Alphaproteobacteria]GEO86126.1 ATP synthase epsilon chain [Ciceribacter naphthalenivorans]GLR22693.1 ATP synthase epsilon chain [Ciceribacter naphthalenivorans]GLT05549.1 ATP synthase epsilon chain [Sphingomonas psychrolutea]
MASRLSLSITTPFEVLADEVDIQSLRAEDASGSFGILPGHAEFLTVLPVSVVRWKNSEGEMRYCALRGGVLTVSDGSHVAIACRHGILGTQLSTLAADVAAFQEEEKDAERRATTEQTRMHARAVRQLMSYLNPRGGTGGSLDFKDGAP